MLLKKSEIKDTIIKTVICLIALTAITAGFKFYHDSKYEKAEYDRICPQNYGDPISLERCYWPYKFEGETLDNAIKIEIAAILIVPILIFLAYKTIKNKAAK
jgi:hypothetical protein